MSFRLNFENSKLYQNSEKFHEKIDTAVSMYMQTKSIEYESYMKTHRPWTDRTGMAKATLFGDYSKPKEHLHRITLGHGVEYGIYLELAHDKNYAIVGPTIQIKGNEVVSDLKDLFSKIKF